MLQNEFLGKGSLKNIIDIINELDARKILLVIGKKSLAGKKTQVNLSDGRNMIYGDKISVGDSVLVNFKDSLNLY